MKKAKKITFFFFLFSFFFFLLVNAQGRKLEVDYPSILGLSPQTIEDIAVYIKYLITFILIAAGVFMLFGLVKGGIQFLTSAGDPMKLMAAKDQLVKTVFGILILLSFYLILNTISPQFTQIRIPSPLSLTFPSPSEVPYPQLEEPNTINEAEIPFGQLINGNGLFEIVKPPNREKARLDRIKENAKNTEEISKKLKKNSEELEELTHECTCGSDCIACRCCNSGCCDSDPCCEVRRKIEKIQKKNLDLIDQLKIEQASTTIELKELKIEWNKVRKGFEILMTCPPTYLESLVENFARITEYYRPENWILRKIKVWNEADIVYFNPFQQKQIFEWATFYCPKGGFKLEEVKEKMLVEKKITPPEEKEEPSGAEYEEKLSCGYEAPVGEIFERAIRMGDLLIKQMERLNFLQGEMIGNIDKFHVLISQCSSTRCYPVCGPMGCDRCEGEPCPYAEISQQLKKIKDIYENIKKTVYELKIEPPQGIVPLIDEVISALLEDLEFQIRRPMQRCISEKIQKPHTILRNCMDATEVGSDPEGDLIRVCCHSEQPYQDCLDNCYLQVGHQNFRNCLKNCLLQKPEEFFWCRRTHKLNFYCCHPEGKPFSEQEAQE